MKNEHSTNGEYRWILAFEDDDSYRKVAQFLNEIGSLAGSESVNFECPDGKHRQAIELDYDVLTRVQQTDAKRGKDLELKFYVMRKRGGGKVEFWPPGRGSKSAWINSNSRPVKDAPVITGKQLLEKMGRKKTQYPPQVEDGTPSPFG